MKKLIIWLIVMTGQLYNSQSQTLQLSEEEKLNWHSFEWQNQPNGFFADIPQKIMVTQIGISGIPEKQAFVLNLSSPFSIIYDYAYDVMAYRNPAFATMVESVQRVSTRRDRVMRDIELSAGRQLLGTENMRIVETHEASRNENIKGILGFGIFHRNDNILLIDNVNHVFAGTDKLPLHIEEHAVFVPMRVENGYLVIPVSLGGRETDLYFDGTSRPALVLNHNRTFRQAASSEAANEKLIYFTRDDERVELEGFQPDTDIAFMGLPLSKHNVYNSPERSRGGIRGIISQAFFKDYIMILDYRNNRFGIIEAE